MTIVTMKKAQMLIARELGVKNIPLKNMGQYRETPCFAGMSGKVKVTVGHYYEFEPSNIKNGIVELRAYFKQSGHFVRLFFFNDDLTFAEDVTAYEKLGAVSEAIRRRMRNAAVHEINAHFNKAKAIRRTETDSTSLEKAIIDDCRAAYKSEFDALAAFLQKNLNNT